MSPLSIPSAGCFFLDACILLPQSLGPYAESCVAFLKNASSESYVSSSVYSRVSSMLDDAYDWVARDIQENLRPYLIGQGINELTSKDALIFEQFFHERRRQLASFKSPGMYFEIEGQIEHWIVSEIHSITLGREVKVDIFLAAILSTLSRIYESLRSPIDVIIVKDITPSKQVKSHVFSQGVRKAEDVEHLASAIEFQFKNNVWVVFVTFDQKHILSHKSRLFEICAIHCSKPDYALDHLKNLTREKKPIEYYKNITPHSQQQLSFAGSIERVLGTKLIP